MINKRTVVLILLAALGVSSGRARGGGFSAEALYQLGDVEKKIIQLEGAIPQEKFTWRPGEGVRSVSEVYLHIAGANYLMMSIAGFPAPPESKWSRSEKDWETQTTDKAKIQEILQKSFDHIRACLGKVTDADLDQQVDFFGTKVSKMSEIFTAIAHLHEHLGQSIAYARTNGVVPPWTAAQQTKK